MPFVLIPTACCAVSYPHRRWEELVLPVTSLCLCWGHYCHFSTEVAHHRSGPEAEDFRCKFQQLYWVELQVTGLEMWNFTANLVSPGHKRHKLIRWTLWTAQEVAWEELNWMKSNILAVWPLDLLLLLVLGVRAVLFSAGSEILRVVITHLHSSLTLQREWALRAPELGGFWRCWTSLETRYTEQNILHVIKNLNIFIIF